MGDQMRYDIEAVCTVSQRDFLLLAAWEQSSGVGVSARAPLPLSVISDMDAFVPSQKGGQL